MRSVLEYCVLVLCVHLLGATRFRSDYTFLEEVDGWIKLHRVPATWPEARLRCDLEGSVLVSPTTAQFLETMKNLMAANQYQSHALFTGIHDTFSKGDYFSIEGVPLREIPVSWAVNEPDNLENSEDCLVLFSIGTLADVRCDAVYSYACYKKRTDDMPAVTECGTTDSEYYYEPKTGSCYKYHYDLRSWPLAFKTCAAEGGYLAIPNSAEEIQVYEDLYFEKLRHPRAKNSKKIVNLGFHYSFERENWLTIHGETLEKAGYSIWAGNEPNNFTNEEQNWEGEYCGSIDMGCTDVGLNDIWCGYKHPFICEKDPKSLQDTPTNKEVTITLPTVARKTTYPSDLITMTYHETTTVQVPTTTAPEPENTSFEDFIHYLYNPDA